MTPVPSPPPGVDWAALGGGFGTFVVAAVVAGWGYLRGRRKGPTRTQPAQVAALAFGTPDELAKIGERLDRLEVSVGSTAEATRETAEAVHDLATATRQASALRSAEAVAAQGALLQLADELRRRHHR